MKRRFIIAREIYRNLRRAAQFGYFLRQVEAKGFFIMAHTPGPLMTKSAAEAIQDAERRREQPIAGETPSPVDIHLDGKPLVERIADRARRRGER